MLNEDFSTSTIDKNDSQMSLISELGKKIFTQRYDEKTDISTFSINDLNNYIGASRKLIINNSQEFWVHDSLLIQYSKFFDNLFNTKTTKPIKEEEIIIEDNKIIKTYINIPQNEFFFDILTWIYSQEKERLIMIADEPDNFLSILNLGIFLELNENFFNIILNNCEVKLDINLIHNNLWSRFCFNFDVLLKLMEYMNKKDHLLKISALLSWLKYDNKIPINKNIFEEDINKRELELLTSKEYFLVKDYIKENNLINNLKLNELYEIKNNYNHLVPILDFNYLFEKYIEKNNYKIHCKICGKFGKNIEEFNSTSCVVKLYHPKKFITFQRQITNKCEHESCKKKININEYPCCHKPNHVEGCILSNGSHILSIYN
jgi:hypothetical protein